MRSKQPYVVGQGDYLLRIAHRLGFDPDVVWQDDVNSSLRQLRKDPNIRCPTDVLFVPTPKDPPSHQLVTGSTNTFISNAPTVQLSVKFLDDELGSQPCTIDELDHLTALKTESDGSLTFDAPVTLKTATIRFAPLDVTCLCRIAWLDPVKVIETSCRHRWAPR